MLLYLISLTVSFRLVSATLSIWENKRCFEIFLLCFPFLAPLIYQIKIRLKRKEKSVEICFFSKGETPILSKVFSICLELIIIIVFEFYIQFKISEIFFQVCTIFVFAFPLLHLCLQNGKDFCSINAFYGAIMSLLWSLWFKSKTYDADVIFFQRYILLDGLKWLIVAISAYVLWELYYKAKKHIGYHNSEKKS